MRRPNILILHTDQQRWDALGVAGNPDIRTPNLDRLASQGTCFDHHFVQNPVCMPSRVSFLTGQYPSTLRITHMGVPVPEDTVTLPRLLRNYGYRSANIGKLHFLPHANRDHRDTHPDYGFDHLEISDEPGCYEDAYHAWVARKAPDQLDKISVGLPPATEKWHRIMGLRDRVVHPEERFPKRAIPARCRSDLTHTAFVAEQTVEFLKSTGNRPFCCVAGFYSPHSPWVAPQEWLDLYDPGRMHLPEFPPEMEARRGDGHFSDEELRAARQGYYAMVSEVDHHVGRILDALERLGLAENTVVVFTSDHGEWLGEHLKYGKGYPAFDCISRVPLLVRWPAGFGSEGRVVHRIVEQIDVVPTLLECAGIPIPGHLQGRSLAPLCAGAEPDAPTEGLGITEHRGWKSVRAAGFRYVCESGGRESLFDLEADPGAYRNVADEPRYFEVLSDLRKRLMVRLLEAERPLPRIWPY